MKKNEKSAKKLDRDEALYFIKTFSDTIREPFLILDFDLRVIGANPIFYKSFQVTKKQTKNQLIYDLGNGQWDIPELRKLLEDILPRKKVFNDFEVAHNFPKIGLKIMLLNARKLNSTRQILLAIEDITLRRTVEKKLASYTKNLKKGVTVKTAELKARMDELEKLNRLMVGRELKMVELKKKIRELEDKGEK